ncbi:GIY-YIG nuclease family protein [Aliiglaciecola sp. M165]|nr:GIY-YIG nuclease family protein [Aliiglaciecola sp. M165]
MYLIENRLGQLYCGISTDLARRFSEHQKNGKQCAKALKGKGPLTLRYAAILEDHGSALKCEYWMKKQNRHHKDAIIAGKQKLPFPHETVSDEEIRQIEH